MNDFFVNIRIYVPDELAQGYDPTEILENLLRRFIEDPEMRHDKSCFALIREMGDVKTDIGFLELSTNCPLVYNGDKPWRSTTQ